MSVPSTCPPKPELERYLLGELPAEKIEALKQHLAECPTCQAAVQSFWPEETQAHSSSEESIVELPASGGAAPLQGSATGNPHVQPTVTAASAWPGAEGDRSAYDFLAPAEAEDEIGRLGPYRVLKVLGAGGMGVVFLAEDPALKRRVALKTMKPEVAASEVNRKRFLREAQSTAQLEHDHIVPIYQVGEAQGVPYLAMQLLKGESLDERLKRERRLPTADVLRLGREMAAGLAAAHERGLVHRDIKPGNVWLEELAGGRWRVKLVDFGLARGGSDDPNLTETGFVVGTPAYMSPEQAQGKPVDARGDLFSLGCVLYRAITGQVPFRGKDVISTLIAVASTSPKRPSELNPEMPPALDALIMNLLAKYPQERPDSAAAVGEELAAIESDQTVTTGENINLSRADTRLLPRPRRFSLWPLAGAAALLLAALGAASFLYNPGLFVARHDGQTTPGSEAPVTRDSHPGTKPDTGRVPVRPGTLRIEGDDAKVVSLNIKQGNRVLHARTTDREFLLPPGKYLVELADATPSVELLQSQVTIESGRQQKVQLRVKPPPPKWGEQLGPFALVMQPATLEGVRGWTVETKGHRGLVRAVAYSPEGKRLATAGNDGSVRLWEASTGKLERILLGHEDAVILLAWSPDGGELASRGLDLTVRIWDANTGKQRRLIKSGAGHALAWSPDGHTLAASHVDGAVRLWDTRDGRAITSLSGAAGEVRTLAFSPDGKTLAAGGLDKTIRLWPPVVGAKPVALRVQDDTIVALSWSPDGKYLASACRDHTVRIWDPETGKSPRIWSWEHGAKPKSGRVLHSQVMAWAPKGQTLAALTPNGAILWKPDADKPLRTLTEVTNGSVFSWSADAKSIAVASYDEEPVRIFDSSSGKTSLSLPSYKQERAHLASWSPGGKYLATVADGRDRGKAVAVWESSTGRMPYYLRVSGTHDITELAWPPDAKRLAAVCGLEGKVYLWDTSTGKPLSPLTVDTPSLLHVAWSADGKTLAAAGSAGKLFFWDADSGKLFAQPTAHSAAVTALTWTPDGKVLASSGTDSLVRFWDASGKLLKPELRPYNGGTVALAWSPNGKRLATAGFLPELPVQVWDYPAGKVLFTLKGHDVKITELTFLTDDRVVGHGDNGSLRIWELPSGQMQAVLPRPGSWQLPPERGLGMTASTTATLRLWDFDSHRPQATLVQFSHGPSGSWLSLTADGRYHTHRLQADMVYVVLTDQGQETLIPDEFKTRYKWRNDPEKIQLVTPPGKDEK